MNDVRANRVRRIHRASHIHSSQDHEPGEMMERITEITKMECERCHAVWNSTMINGDGLCILCEDDADRDGSEQ